MARFVRIEEVVSRLQIDPEFIETLVREEVVEVTLTVDHDRVLSAADAERVRIAWLLTHELDVNLAGVEVIVRMRELILEMQSQFTEILDALLDEARQRGIR